MHDIESSDDHDIENSDGRRCNNKSIADKRRDCSEEPYCGSLKEKEINSEPEDAQIKIPKQLRSSDSLQNLQDTDEKANDKANISLKT